MNTFLSLEKEYDELYELIKITAENDEKLISEINKNTNQLIKKVKKKEFESFLSGDENRR